MGGSTYDCNDAQEWRRYTEEDSNSIYSKIEKSYLSTSVLSSNVIFAKGDSGATSHYIRINDAKKCLYDIEDYNGPSVTLPDAGTIAPTLQGRLQLLSKLSKEGQRATALPKLKSSSLISLGQLCDDDCTVVLEKRKMLVVKNNDIILRGARNQQDGLWDIPIQKTQLQSDKYRNPAQHGFLYFIRKTDSLKQPQRTKPVEK